MITWGITALSHDAAISVIKDGEILFAAHAERYSRIKNDDKLNRKLIQDALYSAGGAPDQIVWYEDPWKKKLRHLQAFQFKHAFTTKDLPKKYLHKLFWDELPETYGLVKNAINNMTYVDHHMSHAAGGYFTSPFRKAKIIVLDAIGEFDTLSLWDAEDDNLEKVYSKKYPYSVGLFYSALTHLCGLKPNEEEYILMGMAGFCDMSLAQLDLDDTITELKEYILDWKDTWQFECSHMDDVKNLHKGVDPEFLKQHGELTFEEKCKIAKYGQLMVEATFNELVSLHVAKGDNLILAGGVALNCVANAKILQHFPNKIWIMPNPGDAGSSLGCALAHTKMHIKEFTPYLGYEMTGEYPVDDVVEALLRNEIVGVANGRAEFGPRALGNRSLLADPRGNLTQEKVNEIKKRDQFRPFAPVIMEEHFDEYFTGYHPMRRPGWETEMTSPYMQYTFKCKKPDEFPAICHVDGTSRVQTVNEKQHPGLYQVLKKFRDATGCPMLLNTSLNIKGEPLVNTYSDALDFRLKYGITVYTAPLPSYDWLHEEETFLDRVYLKRNNKWKSARPTFSSNAKSFSRRAIKMRMTKRNRCTAISSWD